MVKYLITGQGIAGSLMAIQCLQRSIPFKVIDFPRLSRASRVAAGIINPITGRKFVKTWMYEDLEEVFVPTYRWIEQLLAKEYLEERQIIRAIPSIKDQNNWDARMLDEDASVFMESIDLASDYKGVTIEKYSYGAVKGYQLRINDLVEDLRTYLSNKGLLIEDEFEHDQLILHADSLEYKGVKSQHIIFCEGHQVNKNPYFHDLPFTPAKGELLLVKIPDLKTNYILKDHLFIAPWKADLYWVGASYAWEEFSDEPTASKRKWLVDGLEKMINTPYEIIEHLAGVRPATKFRRPLMGSHLKHKNLHLFNGLGTKGSSLGPYWAKHFFEYLEDDCQLDRDVKLY